MPKPEKMPLTSMSITEDQKRKLREVFPEVFNEDRIDWKRLKLTLGQHLDPGEERFGMTWPGKSECFRVIQEPSVGTLKPCPEESVDWEATQNLFIEGDNLEVLKLLQRAYYGKVKMIYIDPPYNTGNEFIYPDKFSESLETYLAYAGLSGDDGRKYSSNSKDGGQFHTKWLNMMYPRLFLANNLLSNEGIIFISIDDNESGNLRKICDEIFGEENFLACIAWEKRYTRSNNAKLFYSLKDTILVYRKTISVEILREPRTEKSDSIYSNPDKDAKGPWTSSSYVNPATKAERPNLVYEIENPFTGEKIEHPTHAWKYEKKEHDKHVSEGRLWWGRDGSAKYPRLKNYLSETSGGLVPIDFWDYKSSGTTDEGGMELKALFGYAIFDNPKPTKLIERAIRIATGPEDIILDFFSGSCTTAHAVLDQNIKDCGKRKFIMVQLPETCNEIHEAFNNNFQTISQIGKERIRRVIAKIKKECESQTGGPLFPDEKPDLDLGFRVFKLDRSNFKVWDGRVEEDGGVTQQGKLFQEDGVLRQMELALDPVDPRSTDGDILFEILLKAGFELTTPVAELSLAGKKVHSVSGDALLICLDRNLTKEVITEMAKRQPARVVCLDSGFAGNDQLKTNAVQIMKSHGVEDFRTV